MTRFALAVAVVLILGARRSAYLSIAYILAERAVLGSRSAAHRLAFFVAWQTVSQVGFIKSGYSVAIRQTLVAVLDVRA